MAEREQGVGWGKTPSTGERFGRAELADFHPELGHRHGCDANELCVCAAQLVEVAQQADEIATAKIRSLGPLDHGTVLVVHANEVEDTAFFGAFCEYFQDPARRPLVIFAPDVDSVTAVPEDEMRALGWVRADKEEHG